MEVIKHKRAKIRKDHRCWGCTKILEWGTVVDITVSADAGKISTAYWCDICAEIAQEYDDGNGYCYGEMREEAEERRLQGGGSA